MKMIEERNSIQTNQTDESLSPPLFDANASASAQPVEPIRRSTFSSLKEKLRSANRHISGRSRMLAVVILIGLITGALAGMLLVNIARTSQPAPALEEAAKEPVSEMPATETQKPATETQKLDTFAAELGGSDGQTVSSTVTGNRRPRARVRTNRPRAYRVATIR